MLLYHVHILEEIKLKLVKTFKSKLNINFKVGDYTFEHGYEDMLGIFKICLYICVQIKWISS